MKVELTEQQVRILEIAARYVLEAEGVEGACWSEDAAGRRDLATLERAADVLAAAQRPAAPAAGREDG